MTRVRTYRLQRLSSIAILAMTCTAAIPAPAIAQDTIDQVKVLYASAAYEDALMMATRLEAAGRRPEYAQYRVFCLVALGRTAEAEKVIAAVVSTDPSFVPDAKDTSPRIRDMFVRTRRVLVPEIAHRLYQEARESMERRDTATAARKFETVIALIDGASRERPAGVEEEPLLSELRLLASGFLELSRASSSTARPDAPKPSVRTPAAVQALDITAPTPVKQDLPTWVPPDQSSRREFRGAIRVSIAEDGRVTDARMSPAIHPAYDRLLLQAAMAWQYQPALRNGSPIASEKVIEVVLKPR
jgi:hypothetical protein